MGGQNPRSSRIVITRLKEVFRVAPSGRFRPGSSAEQFLATSLCLLLAATPALLIWAVTLPASEAAVITWIASTPISPSFIELSVYQWHGLLRNAALQTSWRDLDAVLQRRLPAVQPFTGASFGPLSSNAQAELPSVAGPHTASAGDQDHAENVLKRVAATNRDSLAAQYLLARWYLANGEASRAFRIADDFVRRPSNVWLHVLPPAQAYASLGPGAAQQREVAAHILIRYLAGQAAILSHVPDQAIPHLRIAIGYANYIEQVANEPGPANARAVDLLSGAAASLLEDEPATAITTMSLYDSLIVAYLRTPAYHDTVTLRSRELLRRPGQQ